MRRLTLAFALLAAPAVAQESYTFTAEHVAGIDHRRVEHNATVCAQARLPEGCAQTQVDAAVPPRLELTLYPDSQAGRADFATEVLFASTLAAAVDAETTTSEAEHDDALRDDCEALSQPDRNAICTLLGRSPGCDPCPKGRGPNGNGQP